MSKDEEIQQLRERCARLEGENAVLREQLAKAQKFTGTTGGVVTVHSYPSRTTDLTAGWLRSLRPMSWSVFGGMY